MELQVLGPVEARHAGELIDLGPRQQRLILAVLGLQAGRIVGVDRLTELLWPAGPPRTARSAIQVRVSRLRTCLGRSAPIIGGSTGYLLDLPADQVDAHRFERLVTDAAAAEADERVRLLRAALELWRGPALSGTTAEIDVRERLCARLEERRLTAYEDCLAAELELGHHLHVLGELSDLASAHPGRDRLTELFMRALHRSGQSARALETARRHRRYLADELGVAPSSRLQEVEQAILREDPAPHQTATPTPGRRGGGARVAGVRRRTDPVIPAQLPAAVPRFVGREEHLRRLDALLDRLNGSGNHGSSADPASVIAVTGTAGVGKTSLAVRWARRLLPRYPDGQLMVDLRGHTSEPVLDPLDALGIMLRGLGVDPASVPTDTETAAGLYRSIAAERRLLVVLDNAVDVDQLEPLLASTGPTLTVVTSRDRLFGLTERGSAARWDLDALPVPESVRLLRRILPADRVEHELDEVTELARVCAGLPLALRIGAAQLADEPELPIRRYVADLRSGSAALSIEDDPSASVRAAFDLSFDALRPAEQQAFRMVALVPGTDWSLPAAAALLGAMLEETRAVLRRLLGASLLDERTEGRFQFHDLLRQYAERRLLAETTPDERDAAYARLLTWYYGHAVRAGRLLAPMIRPAPVEPTPLPYLPPSPITDLAGALAWLEAERSNLLALIADCERTGREEWAIRIARIQRNHLNWSGYTRDDRMIREVAVRAADTLDDAVLQADAYAALAYRRGREDPGRGIEDLRTALHHAERSGDATEIAHVLADLGKAYNRRGEPGEAAEALRRTLDTHPEPVPANFQGDVLQSLGVVYLGQGRFADAADTLRQTATLRRPLGDPLALAYTLRALAIACYRIGLVEEAESLLGQAGEIGERHGDTVLAVFIDTDRSFIHSVAGELELALAEGDRAVATATDLGHNWLLPYARQARAFAYAELGRQREALEDYRLALDLARAHRNTEAQSGLLLMLAILDPTAGADGDDSWVDPRDCLEEALRLCEEHGYRHRVGLLWSAQARIELAEGNAELARDLAERAVRLHRELGDRFGVLLALITAADAGYAADRSARGERAADADHRAEIAALRQTFTGPFGFLAR